MADQKNEEKQADNNLMQTQYTLEYIPARTEDVGYLMDLRKATMAVHFDNSDDHQTEEMLLERVLYRLDCAKLIIINGRRAGLLKVIKEGPEWELCQIQLEKEFQGQGIGGDIIKELLQEAQDQGAGVVLHVLKANPARRLYEKLGFAVIREQAHGYLMRSDRTMKT